MTKFKLRRNNVQQASGDDRLYPQIVLGGTVSLSDLAQEIENGSSLTSADIKAAVSALSAAIARHAAAGKSVRIPGIGTFRARLGYRDEERIETVDAQTKRKGPSVCVNGLYFKASQELVQQTSQLAVLERITTDDKATPVESLEARKDILRQYLSEHPFVNCATYARLTGLSKSVATKELRAMLHEADGFLAAEGQASHRVYVLK
ncbi:MAG: HU family DNA-binding protein [Bacteroidaceae bacterium]|nr:HU family DNA-binding protein [Bacteroidaceae bacterium]